MARTGSLKEVLQKVTKSGQRTRTSFQLRRFVSSSDPYAMPRTQCWSHCSTSECFASVEEAYTAWSVLLDPPAEPEPSQGAIKGENVGYVDPAEKTARAAYAVDRCKKTSEGGDG